MILAAGLGTRLMPLTASTPKALVKVNGTTLLEIAIRRLAAHGSREIIINIHHFPEQMLAFIRDYRQPGVTLAVSDESGELLDTGGAILHARWFLDGKEPFLVHNVDVISDISLDDLYQSHIKSGNLATLAVSERKSSRYFLFDKKSHLAGWKDTANNVIRHAGRADITSRPLAFSGIHVISPGIFPLLTEKGRFSIVDAYLRLAEKHPICAFRHSPDQWFDVGKPGQIEPAAAYLSSIAFKPGQP